MDSNETIGTMSTTTGLPGIDYGALTDLSLDAHEVALIGEALRRTKSIREAADLLQITRFALGRRLEKFGIKPERAMPAKTPKTPKAEQAHAEAAAEPAPAPAPAKPRTEASKDPAVNLPPKRTRPKRAKPAPTDITADADAPAPPQAGSDMIFSGGV